MRGPSGQQEAAGVRAKAVWTAESAAERDRLLQLPPASRLAALDHEETRLLLTKEHRAEIRASLLPGSHEEPGREDRAAAWAIERRRLALLHVLRPWAAGGCIMAALVPFAVAVWRRRMDVADVLVTFVAPGRGLLGVLIALVVAVVLARRADRAETLEGLGGLVVGSLVAGVAGLAVARGLVF
jgi:hypothetical protein